MKLQVDFASLWHSVRQMGAGEADFEWVSDRRDADMEFDNRLTRGEEVEISLEDLENDNGLLSVNGVQILLFIPDNGFNISAVLSGEAKKGKRFHVADCRTLERMRQANRFARYKVTNNLGGSFHIHGTDSITGQTMEGEARLLVCRDCLTYLNYKNYKAKSKNDRTDMVEQFGIGEFFASYSSLFRSLPKNDDVLYGAGYSDDWRQVSLAYRRAKGFVCENCGVSLFGHERLLHTHHINGNKRDNRDANLRALCMDCHRKEPMHNHMQVRHKDMKLINQLRRKQVLLDNGSWGSIFKLADPAVHGLLYHYKAKNKAKPQVGYELVGPDQAVIAQLELAWPEVKEGIAIDLGDRDRALHAGWHVLSVGEAMQVMNR